MGERICSDPTCQQPYFSRSLCRLHYGRAYRSGKLVPAQPALPIDVHAITNGDRDLRVGHCSICGPGTRVRIHRDTGRLECENKRFVRRSKTGRPGPKKARTFTSSLDRSLQQKYGLTEVEFLAMVERQNNACAICRQVPKRRLHVDHCHETGQVRGLLCHGCNVGIGFFRDDPELLRQAANYVA